MPTKIEITREYKQTPAPQTHHHGTNVALTLVGLVIIIAILVWSFYNMSPITNGPAKCDVATENSTLIDSPLGYTSATYQDQLRGFALDPAANVRIQTATPAVGAVNSIAGDDVSSVTSSVDKTTAETVLTSTKTMDSGLPLGWEMILSDVPLTSETNYAAIVTYKSTVETEVGLNYRAGDTVSSSEVIEKLPATKDWSSVVLHIDAGKTGLVPSVTLSSMTAGSMSVKDIRVVMLPPRDLGQGIVTVAFDDGWRNIYTKGLPIFRKYDVHTSQFIISDYSLGGSALGAYMTRDMIRTLAAQGHDIESHSYQHCDARSLSDDKLKSSIAASQTEFNKQLNISPTIYAHPFGSYDDRVNNDLAKTYDFIRSSDAGFNTAYFDPHNIHIQSVEANTSLDQIKAWVDQAANTHTWLVLLYHQVDGSGAYSITTSALSDQLQYITKRSGISVQTMAEAIRMIQAK